MILLQAIPFIVALVGLHVIIFKPMLAMLAERERNIHGFRTEAELLQDEVSGKVAELEARLVDARAEANAERNRLRSEAKKVEDEILTVAHAKADAALKQARATLEADAAASQASLEAAAAQLSRQIASTVLGRSVEDN